MENAHTSGMIHMFLSGTPTGPGIGDISGYPSVTPPPKRLLLACAGADSLMSGIAGSMAFRFGRNNAQTRCFGGGLNLFETDCLEESRQLAGCDGMFMGVAPDGSGNTDQAICFIRNHFDVLSTIPVALFFILPGSPAPGEDETLPGELSFFCPLNVRYFDPSFSDLPARITEWASNIVWPLMETRWLADMIFPEPAASTRCF